MQHVAVRVVCWIQTRKDEIKKELSDLDKIQLKKDDKNSREVKELEHTLNSVKTMIDFQKKKVKSVNGQLHYQRLNYEDEIKNLIKENLKKSEKLSKFGSSSINCKFSFSDFLSKALLMIEVSHSA